MSKIRPASASDVPAVINLIDAAYRHYIPQLSGRRPRPMDDDQAARVANNELFVLEDDGTMLGVFTMEVQPEAVHIFNLAVHPEPRAAACCTS